MTLFDKKLVNLGRQIEADFAKAVCLIGMVLVHSFEELPLYFLADQAEESTAAYIIVVVLDAIFGAATFMFCMGFGITYTSKNDADSLIHRGLKLLLYGYLLNIARFVIPELLARILFDGFDDIARSMVVDFLIDDILQFAGLALLLMGILKKLKLSDTAIAVIAVCMSAVGSFVRNIDTAALLNITNEIAKAFVILLSGLFVGTIVEEIPVDEISPFPLLNWFIFVVAGYLFAKAMMRCKSKGKFYAIASPCCAAVVITYMIIAIPRRAGMMSGNLNMYYHLTTPEVLICLAASVSVFGMYYGLSNILPKIVSRVAMRISKNLTHTYLIHWVLIELLPVLMIVVMERIGIDSESFVLSTGGIFIFAVFILIVSSALAELYRKNLEKKRK